MFGFIGKAVRGVAGIIKGGPLVPDMLDNIAERIAAGGFAFLCVCIGISIVIVARAVFLCWG